ncbi:UDP-N-acetylmuramoyl-L-alanine--D-glutamate ligase [Anaerosacchariphilus polymeriproducens]|uniref:UDP-N-acetylmuramoylalanine--D-glutamate ligase n=1 Tax=Anaerosacchariphilus polymeriproducens TaxID=1812858 RepID=A0A371B070_9FIRM|nr:UDP-N-acetylmuramoyl-L-alanine--D-glutamate ligase [Anaerosacchariphilus polymeriproducens]RDU25268.1 UDP-N-acetylmuramoyl-L-alanine--D-glutamate ligase [Anaerosacchariphilus polymeriproducens]
MDLLQKCVLVVGTGISGIGAVELLETKNIKTLLYDGNKEVKEEYIRNKLPKDSKTQIIIGDIEEELLDQIDIAVLSPGVPTDLPFVEKMRKRNIVIWGEIELAFYFEKGSVLAITGTNGKTTTTALLGEIMRNYHKNTFVVGNIGTPYTSTVLNTNQNSVTVAEVSSFQLETIENFHPVAAAILNITPDHLNRHHTMENYQKAKEAIVRNQTFADTCVLNYDDHFTREFGKTIQSKVVYFSRLEKLQEGIYIDSGTIVFANEKDLTPICRLDELQLLGGHNHENVMAVIAMSISYGVPIHIIQETVKRFQGVEHRIEFVTERNGVAYYNDSKGTNPDAAIKGIQAMNRPTFLIGGGYDKDSQYDEWIQAFEGKVKWLVLLGATREKIAEAAKRQGFTNIIFAECLKEAVEICAKKAEKGDAVLLSPACASWGMFKNYEERGRKFKEYVNELKE